MGARMKALTSLAVLFVVSAAASNAFASSPVHFDEECFSLWFVTEQPLLVLVCVDDDASPMPPSRTAPETQKRDSPSRNSSRNMHQQKSRRFPGGFLEADVKKRD